MERAPKDSKIILAKEAYNLSKAAVEKEMREGIKNEAANGGLSFMFSVDTQYRDYCTDILRDAGYTVKNQGRRLYKWELCISWRK